MALPRLPIERVSHVVEDEKATEEQLSWRGSRADERSDESGEHSSEQHIGPDGTLYI